MHNLQAEGVVNRRAAARILYALSVAAYRRGWTSAALALQARADSLHYHMKRRLVHR